MKDLSSSTEVTVYNFVTFDGGPEHQSLAPFKASRETISTVLKGKVLEGTAEKVRVSQLDPEGRYRRIATGWGDLL